MTELAAPPAENYLPLVDIRLLAESDLSALEWDGEFTHFRRVYANAYKRMKKGLALLWVAALPGAGLIGQTFVQLSCDRPILADGRSRAYIYSFRVRQPYRRAGLGTRMMAVVEADLRRRGRSRVTLNVAKDNRAALQLYQRLGYKIAAPESGRWSYPDHEGVWHQVVEPAWRMEKKL